MVPNIQPKDVILVEKVSPPLKRLLNMNVAKSDDVLFFQAPTRMLNYIEKNKLPSVRNGDLIIKRVRSVDPSSSSFCYYMLGDNPSVSLDSRYLPNST